MAGDELGAAGLLLESGLILGAVALTGRLSGRFGVSAIPAYIIIGLLLGPFVSHSELVEVLAVWGVVLLLFFIGLEFSFGALIGSRSRLLRLGIRDFVINFPVGVVAGLLLGWGVLGGLLLGAALYISSSAIIAKSLIELRRTANPETEALLGTLVFEDITIAVILALLSGVVFGSGGLAGGAVGAVRAILFLLIIVVVARFGRPTLERLLDTDDDDVFLLLLGAAILLMAGSAVGIGVSEAIGAFLAGSLIAETRHKARAERLFAPLQGLFAAVFFLSFGLSVDLGSIGTVLPVAMVIAAFAIAAKIVSGMWSGRSEGLGPRASLMLGLSLLPRGEFSIVIAALAARAGYADAPELVTVLVLILAIVGTVALRNAPELSARLTGVGAS